MYGYRRSAPPWLSENWRLPSMNKPTKKTTAHLPLQTLQSSFSPPYFAATSGGYQPTGWNVPPLNAGSAALFIVADRALAG
jgi:hypothetical protein